MVKGFSCSGWKLRRVLVFEGSEVRHCGGMNRCYEFRTSCGILAIHGPIGSTMMPLLTLSRHPVPKVVRALWLI